VAGTCWRHAVYTSEVGDGGLQMADTFSYKCTQCRIGEQFEL